MGLPNNLISEFAKLAAPEEKNNEPSILYGTITKDASGTFVKIDGSDILTPASTTTSVSDGERVTVMIKDHSAIVTGNITSPAPSATDLEDASKVATNYIGSTPDGLIIGNMSDEVLGKNVKIDPEGIEIRDGDNTLASFESNRIKLGTDDIDAELIFGDDLMRLHQEPEPVVGSDETIVYWDCPDNLMIRCPDASIVSTAHAPKPYSTDAHSDTSLTQRSSAEAITPVGSENIEVHSYGYTDWSSYTSAYGAGTIVSFIHSVLGAHGDLSERVPPIGRWSGHMSMGLHHEGTDVSITFELEKTGEGETNCMTFSAPAYIVENPDAFRAAIGAASAGDVSGKTVRTRQATSAAVSVANSSYKTLISFTLASGYNYVVDAWVSFANNATGRRELHISDTSNAAATVAEYVADFSVPSGVKRCKASFIIPGDGKTHYLVAWQNSGSALSASAVITLLRCPG